MDFFSKNGSGNASGGKTLKESQPDVITGEFMGDSLCEDRYDELHREHLNEWQTQIKDFRKIRRYEGSRRGSNSKTLMQQQNKFKPRTRDSLAKWYAKEADNFDSLSKFSEKNIQKVSNVERHLFNFEQQSAQWKATLRNCWHMDQPLIDNSVNSLFATNKKVNPLVHRVTSAVN